MLCKMDNIVYVDADFDDDPDGPFVTVDFVQGGGDWIKVELKVDQAEELIGVLAEAVEEVRAKGVS